jgi:hypothetical protein
MGNVVCVLFWDAQFTASKMAARDRMRFMALSFFYANVIGPHLFPVINIPVSFAHFSS